MCEHPVRLSELRRALPNASKKSLTASLRSLEAAKIVLRRDLSNSLLHVEYELTESARESLPTLLGTLAEWKNTHEDLFPSHDDRRAKTS
jgi:DNA-binding HxlR family transcriptional regulator